MRSVFVALLAFLPLWSWACVNTYDPELMRYDSMPDPAQLSAKIGTLEKALENGGDYKVANDLAVTWILFGNYPRAIELLEGIEAKHSGEGLFRTASNLGTAYELNGQSDKALPWIKEGVKRNPADHEGTEWLHVKILEANLAIEKNPDWLKTHYVADVDFGGEGAPRAPDTLPKDFLGNQKSLQELGTALQYQLKERMKFVKGMNPVVADLLLSRGDAQALLSVPGYYVSWELALERGSEKNGLLNKRLSYANDKQMIRAALCGALFAGAIIYGYRRRIVRKKKLRGGEAMASQQQSTGQEPGALTGSPSGWKRLGTRLFALTDQAYSTPFIGIRLLMWVLVLGWGLVWIARSCEVNSPLTWVIFATTVVGALAHGRVVLRRERPSSALQWGAWKWAAIDAAGLAIITFVYAAPLKYLVPGSQCGPGVSSATIDPMSGFIAGFFGAFLIWGLAAILGKANQERKREAGQ